MVCQRNIVLTEEHLIQQNDKETTKWYPIRVVTKDNQQSLVFNKNSVVIYTALDEKKKKNLLNLNLPDIRIQRKNVLFSHYVL